MSEGMRIRSLGVEQPGKAYFFEYQDGALQQGFFRVETLYTGLSAGTELTFFKGSNPYLHARWDEHFAVFLPEEPTARFPVPFLGYMECGRVVESRARHVHPGQIVAMAYGHKTAHTADPRVEFFAPLPEDLDPLLGIFVAQMGPICANGLLHAAAELTGNTVRDLSDGVRGRNVLVMGAGVIGLLTAIFSRHCGAAAVAVADDMPFRREIAGQLGFPAVEEAEAWRYCKETWWHGGADVAFQCRAHSVSLHQALRALRPQSTLIDLAFYQQGAEALRLGEEFHHNALGIRCAQIGRVPRGLSFTWDRQRLAQETIQLLRAEGQAIRDHIITNVIPLNEAPEFLTRLIEQRPDFLQIVFQVGHE
jgi:NADPH:quinone reductase-like Zn-dependent oxidoreductase